MNRISRDLQIKSQVKHTWRTTNPWNQLLGHLHPSSCMSHHLFLLHFIHITTVENMPIGFHHGLSTGTHTNTALYVTECRQPLQVQSHLEMPGILVQLGHIQRT